MNRYAASVRRRSRIDILRCSFAPPTAAGWEVRVVIAIFPISIVVALLEVEGSYRVDAPLRYYGPGRLLGCSRSDEFVQAGCHRVERFLRALLTQQRRSLF